MSTGDDQRTIGAMRRIQVDGEGSRGARRLSGDRGAAAVEFAFVLPVLMMLLFAIFAFSTAYNTKTQLTGAVREGARARALGAEPIPTALAVRKAAPGLQSTAIDVDEGPECPESPDADDNATVSASYEMKFTIPFWREGTWRISETGVMRCGL